MAKRKQILIIKVITLFTCEKNENISASFNLVDFDG